MNPEDSRKGTPFHHAVPATELDTSAASPFYSTDLFDESPGTPSAARPGTLTNGAHVTPPLKAPLIAKIMNQTCAAHGAMFELYGGLLWFHHLVKVCSRERGF
jgi:hypothetical protein